MKLNSLSATSALVFELCEARWRAERIDWAESPGTKAAGLGTVCHATLEGFVVGGYHESAPYDAKVLTDLYTHAYEAQFADRAHYAEGLKLVLAWQKRQVWAGREVISTERKTNFKLPTSDGDKPVNYIWDRCDRLADGSIEVVDYKTNVAPLTHEQLDHTIQARLYGLAAQLQFPEVDAIWVTFDYLRHQPVGVRFTKEQNGETWRYMRRLAERILVSDGRTETLNDQCRWCVRRHECSKLKAHVVVGGPLGITDPFVAAERRRELDAVKSALAVMIDELDQVILAHMDSLEEPEFTAGDTKVSLTISSRRHINDRAAALVLGPDLMERYGGLTIGTIDDLLKGSELDDVAKKELKDLIYPMLGAPKVKTTKVAAL